LYNINGLEGLVKVVSKNMQKAVKRGLITKLTSGSLGAMATGVKT